MKLRIKMQSSFVLPRFILEATDMAEIGKRAADTVRWRVQVDLRGAKDQAAPRLTEAYRRRKQAKVGKSVRNLTVTGKFLSQLHSWGASRSKVMVGWTSKYGKDICAGQSRYYDFLGLSPSDKETVGKLLQEKVSMRAKSLKFWRGT